MGTQHKLIFFLLMSSFGLHFLISTYISSSLISNTTTFLNSDTWCDSSTVFNVLLPSSQVFIAIDSRSQAARTTGIPRDPLGGHHLLSNWFELPSYHPLDTRPVVTPISVVSCVQTDPKASGTTWHVSQIHWKFDWQSHPSQRHRRIRPTRDSSGSTVLDAS